MCLIGENRHLQTPIREKEIEFDTQKSCIFFLSIAQGSQLRSKKRKNFALAK